MRTALVTLSALVVFSPPAPGQTEYTDSWSDHLLLSSEIVAADTGTTFAALERFYEAMASGGSAAADVRSEDCAELLEDTVVARDEFLLCLANHGTAALSEDLFHAVFEEKLRKSRMEESHDDLDIQRTIVLLSWLEDLIRQNLASTGREVDLLIRDEAGRSRFSTGDLEDFEFQDGDVLLSMGASSVSALIPLVTTPQRRFSHAFMIRVRDGKKTALESLIETGARKTKFRKLMKRKSRHVLVLRLPDDVVKTPEVRQEIVTRASDICLDFAERRVRYDMAMDFSNTKRIFCSEMVVACYTQAANESLAEHPEAFDRDPEQPFTPEEWAGRFARVRSEAVARFLSDLGVREQTMPSPGDLVGSDYLTVVADYRQTDRLFAAWVDLLAVHVILDRLENGYEIRRRYTLWNYMIRAIFNVLRTGKKYITRPLGFEFGVIPEAMTGGKVVSLKTYDRQIFKELVLSYWAHVKKTDGAGEPKLLEHPPWDVRTFMSHKAATTERIRKALSPLSAAPAD